MRRAAPDIQSSVAIGARTILMLLLAAGAGASAAPAVPPVPAARAEPDAPAPDALIAQIRAALVESSDGRLDVLLRSLRRVGDPSLRPLFAQLAASGRAILRVHGVLGLAELESPPRVDMLLVKRLPDPREQLVVLGEALRAGMLPAEQLEDVARWSGLDPTLVVLVLGRLERAGMAVDPAALDVFMVPPDPAPDEGVDPMPALLATLERMQQALVRPGVPAPQTGVLDELLASPPSAQRERIAVILLEYIRRERLTAAASVASRLLAEAGESGSVAFESLSALLAVAPRDEATWESFRSMYDAGDLAHRIRLGLAVLDQTLESPLPPPGIAGPPAPALPPAYAALLAADEHPLLAKMGAAAAAALAGCSETVEPVADLVAETHAPTVAWAMRLARHCGGASGSAIALAVLRAAEAAGAASRPGDGAMADAAVAAAALLADTDPAALATELTHASERGDAAMQRMILLGALRSTNPAAAVIVRAPGAENGAPVHLSDPTAAAMATLLEARHRPELTEADYAVLAGIAGAMVPSAPAEPLGEPLRLQAAWLALRCRGHQRVALARILAGDPK